MDCYNRKADILILMEILWISITCGIAISLMEIVYFYCTNLTLIDFVYGYCESEDAKPEQEDARVQKSMYKIFHSHIMKYISLWFNLVKGIDIKKKAKKYLSGMIKMLKAKQVGLLGTNTTIF